MTDEEKFENLMIEVVKMNLKKSIEGWLEDLECYYSSFRDYGIDDGQAELFGR